MKIVDVFATLQLTFPKQYLCVFSRLSNNIPKREPTDIMKKMRAGVHSDLTLLIIPSIEWNEMSLYISILQKNNNTGLRDFVATRTSLLRFRYATLTERAVLWAELSGQMF